MKYIILCKSNMVHQLAVLCWRVLIKKQIPLEDDLIHQLKCNIFRIERILPRVIGCWRFRCILAARVYKRRSEIYWSGVLSDICKEFWVKEDIRHVSEMRYGDSVTSQIQLLSQNRELWTVRLDRDEYVQLLSIEQGDLQQGIATRLEIVDEQTAIERMKAVGCSGDMVKNGAFHLKHRLDRVQIMRDWSSTCRAGALLYSKYLHPYNAYL